MGKVPALILDDGRVVHDSSVIVEYLETLGALPELIPRIAELRVAHKQIEALADGISDAVMLIVLENSRPATMRSADWIERQRGKILAGTAELSRLLAEREWFTEAGFGLAEIAAGCALGYLDLRFPEFDWRASAPNLTRLYARLSLRPSFAETKPEPQALPVTRSRAGPSPVIDWLVLRLRSVRCGESFHPNPSPAGTSRLSCKAVAKRRQAGLSRVRNNPATHWGRPRRPAMPRPRRRAKSIDKSR